MEPQASRVLYLGPQLRVGRFDCSPGHPLWRTANETGRWPLLAFPGTAVEIVQDGSAPLVANANQVVLYNPHQRYHRRLLDGRGDHCVFIGVAPSLLVAFSVGWLIQFVWGNKAADITAKVEDFERLLRLFAESGTSMAET